MCFIGHAFIEKRLCLTNINYLDFQTQNVAHIVGTLEIFAALSVLIRPLQPVIFLLFIWKAASELFYPHWELVEWIERGGSYETILALWFVTRELNINKQILLLIKGFIRHLFFSK